MYDYNAKVIFSIFPSPIGRNQNLTMKNTRKKYSRVYVGRGVFVWGSVRKDIVDLITTFSPEFKLSPIYL